MKDKDAARKKILITLGGGGYLWEAMRLMDNLGDSVDYAYVTGYDSMVPPEFIGCEVHKITTISTKSAPHWWQALPKFVFSTLQACAIVRKAKPHAIVCVAVPSAVPLAIGGKLFGKKTIFIESITRVSHPSMTGRILEKLALADRIYVQWPEAVNLYKNAIYKGTVL